MILVSESCDNGYIGRLGKQIHLIINKTVDRDITWCLYVVFWQGCIQTYINTYTQVDKQRDR